MTNSWLIAFSFVVSTDNFYHSHIFILFCSKQTTQKKHVIQQLRPWSLWPCKNYSYIYPVSNAQWHAKVGLPFFWYTLYITTSITTTVSSSPLFITTIITGHRHRNQNHYHDCLLPPSSPPLLSPLFHHHCYVVNVTIITISTTIT